MGGILLTVLFLWVFIAIPLLTGLPSDFKYQSDIFSLDNFYDVQTQSYTGESRSVTHFAYTTKTKSDGNLLIDNEFSARTVSGEPIFSVKREYGIDPVTGKHVPGYGDKNRDGYLFAPKRLNKSQIFQYWHINYDGPATMKFLREENLHGLPVLVFYSDYEGVTIDQTENLTNLPGVGDTMGIMIEPKLTLWIEPVTGFMVQYQDEAIAYYYDLETGEKLYPWNKFSNTYQRSSVAKNVKVAKKAKALQNVIEIVVPSVLILLIVSLLLSRYRRVSISMIIIGAVILGFYVESGIITPAAPDPLKIGISRFVPNGNPSYDNNIAGFKEALTQAGYIEGEDVIYFDFSASGNQNRQAQIAQEFAEADYDLIYSLTTPGTLALKKVIKDTPIVFSVVTYPVETGVIDSLNYSGNNLVGTRNWVPVSEQLDNFLKIVPQTSTIAFIHRTGEPNSEIQLEEMLSAASSRDMKVVEISAPNLSELNTKLQNTPKNFDAIYSACDTLIQGEAESLIVRYSLTNQIPSFSCNRSGPVSGDLIGTVADFYSIGKLSGEKAVQIFEGATPGSLSTDTVARPYIYINPTTADKLGILIPQVLQAQAKELIQ